MKISKYVVLGAIALTFVLTPAATSAQTIDELLAQIKSLQLQIKILQLQNQILTLQLNAVKQPCGQSGAVYNYQTGQLCAGNATAYVNVLSPNKGETYLTGNQMTVRWNSSLVPSVINVTLHRRSDPSIGIRIGDVGMVNDGIEVWSIPMDTPSANDYFVRVNLDVQEPKLGQDVVAESGTFNIIGPTQPAPSITVVSPNGGEVLRVGTLYKIQWTSNVTDQVLIYATPTTNDNGVSCNSNALCADGSPAPQLLIANLMPNLGSYVWKVGSSVDNPGQVFTKSSYIRVCTLNYCDASDSSFKIYDSGTTNKPPSITGVAGPVQLTVGKSGTWSVTASDPENGPLSYSVIWGDEATTGATAGAAVQQTATFTHTYSTAGTFYPTFTVTDNVGQSARTSLSVVVGSTKSQGVLNVYVRDATTGSPQLLIPVRVAIYQNDLYLTSQSTQFGDKPVVFNLLPGTYRLEVGSELVAYQYNNQIFSIGSGEVKNILVDLVREQPPQPAPTIISSYPPNGAVMAQDISGPGFKAANLTFSGPLDLSRSLLDYFSVSSSNAAGAPSISQVSLNDPKYSVYNLSFSRPLIAGERIRITHKPSGSSVCLGFLPGDVDQNGYVDFGDLSYLQGLMGQPLDAKSNYRWDINRDGFLDFGDISAANSFIGTFLPACPSSAVGVNLNQSQLANVISALTAALSKLNQSLTR